MKRRTTARCAAANDDDLGGDSNSETESVERAAPRKAQKVSIVEPVEHTSVPAPADGPEARTEDGRPPRKKKKEKEFAWMDSGEEDTVDDVAEVSEARSQHGSDEENEDASADKLDTVQSFGRMMLLAPGLRRLLRSGRATPADVAAAYRVLGRTKFFDSDILQELNTALLAMLRDDLLSVTQANDAVQSLRALNAYDPAVFSGVASAFRGKTVAVDPAIRNTWLEIYRSFGHVHQKDFIQLLEVPPLLPANPGFQRIRCRHHSAGSCALGDGCSFSHDPRAPLSLDVSVRHVSPVVMTQNQYTMGRSIYGGARNGQFA